MSSQPDTQNMEDNDTIVVTDNENTNNENTNNENTNNTTTLSIIDSGVTNLTSADRIQMYNACGQGQYVDVSNPNQPTCVSCPTSPPSQYVDMCSTDQNIWLPAQVDANARMDTPNKWTDISTVLMQGTDPSSIPASKLSVSNDILTSWYNDRLTDDELRARMSSNQYDGSLDQFKIDVSTGRGSSIHCIEPSGGTITGYGTPPYSLTLDDNSDWPGCDPSGHFGPRNITLQEVRDWSLQQPINVEEQVEGTRGSTIDNTVSYGDVSNVIGRELMNTNPEFEDCINNILRESDDKNYDQIIDDIHNAGDIRNLSKEHIDYITRKLEILLTRAKDKEVKECIKKNYYEDQTNPSYICSDNLAVKMSAILNILFSTIGFHLNINDRNMNDPVYKQKMMDIIDVVGDIIPRALDRILEITEDLEVTSCAEVTGKTQLLRELHTKLFRPQDRSVDINIDLGPIANVIKDEEDGGFSDNEFNRTAVLGGLVIGLLKFL